MELSVPDQITDFRVASEPIASYNVFAAAVRPSEVGVPVRKRERPAISECRTRCLMFVVRRLVV